MNVFFRAVLVALVAGGSLSSWGGTNGFVVPNYRGLAGTTFTGWEWFGVAQGEPGNVGDMAGSATHVRLYQTAAGAQVLGSGNLYNGASASVFEIRYTLPTGFTDVERVSLQMRTLGTELAYDSVRLIAASGNSSESLVGVRTELDRVAIGPPPPAPGSGFGVSSLWEWDLTGRTVDYFAITVSAAEVNLSLDSATLDVRMVPEPGVVGLGVLGGLLLLATRRR